MSNQQELAERFSSGPPENKAFWDIRSRLRAEGRLDGLMSLSAYTARMALTEAVHDRRAFCWVETDPAEIIREAARWSESEVGDA